MSHKDIGIVDLKAEDQAFDTIAIAVIFELGGMEVILYCSVFHDLFARKSGLEGVERRSDRQGSTTGEGYSRHEDEYRS